MEMYSIFLLYIYFLYIYPVTSKVKGYTKSILSGPNLFPKRTSSGHKGGCGTTQGGT